MSENDLATGFICTHECPRPLGIQRLVKTELRARARVLPSDAAQFVNDTPEEVSDVVDRQRHFFALLREAEDLWFLLECAAGVYDGVAVHLDLPEYVAL